MRTIGMALVFLLVCPMLGSLEKHYRTLRVRVTAYCPCKVCCGSHAHGKTKIGRDARLPGVAVDPKVIPLRSYLDVPGYPRGPNHNGSWVMADDTGDGIHGNHIDLRFETHEEALAWVRTHPSNITIRIWE